MKEGRFVVYDREVFENEADIPDSLRMGKGAFERMSALVDLRDLLKRQLVPETNDEQGIEENRKALAEAYSGIQQEARLRWRASISRFSPACPDGPLGDAKWK